jgi:hypothetical protein
LKIAASHVYAAGFHRRRNKQADAAALRAKREHSLLFWSARRGYLDEHGCPVAFYSDKNSVFRVLRKDASGGQGMTQFGRARIAMKEAKRSRKGRSNTQEPFENNSRMRF